MRASWDSQRSGLKAWAQAKMGRFSSGVAQAGARTKQHTCSRARGAAVPHAHPQHTHSPAGRPTHQCRTRRASPRRCRSRWCHVASGPPEAAASRSRAQPSSRPSAARLQAGRRGVGNGAVLGKSREELVPSRSPGSAAAQLAAMPPALHFLLLLLRCLSSQPACTRRCFDPAATGHAPSSGSVVVMLTVTAESGLLASSSDTATSSSILLPSLYSCRTGGGGGEGGH